MRTLIILWMTMTTSGAQTAELTLDEHVAAGLEELIAQEEVRAATVALYAGGKVRNYGFGRLDEGSEAVPDGDTAYEIGSISKVFTALLTETQVEAQRLSWDQTLASVLPRVTFASDQVAAITLEELADHTSGLPRLPDNMNPPDPLDPYAGYERQHLMAFLSGLSPTSLNKDYEYSNLGAGLLGEIAADAARSSYADAMQSEVFGPLEMNHSAVGLRPDLQAGLARGFSQGASMPNWAGFDALAGAGAIVSTTNDLLRFVSHNLNDGPLADALKAIQTPRPNGETGLGWHIHAGDSDQPVLWHNGGTGGYASFLAINPATQTGAIILSTSTRYDRITELGFLLISGKPVDQAPDVDLSAYPGAYQLAEGFVMTIFVREGRLFGQATGQGAFPLTPGEPDEFEYPAANIRIVFERSGSQPAGKLTLFQGGVARPAPRVADELGIAQREEIDLPAEKLTDYAGRYQLGPSVVITVEARDGQLYAQLSGQAAYPVFPYQPDQFFYRVVDAQLHFERDAQDRVQAVVLHQQGEQRAPRIE